jgi:hypothetical protein
MESRERELQTQLALTVVLNGAVVRKCNSNAASHDVYLRLSADKSLLLVRVFGGSMWLLNTQAFSGVA